MTTPPFLVVGAGPSGLGFATELGRHGPVILLDRSPVAGGAAGEAQADVRRFTAAARQRGVELRLGESALRWETPHGETPHGETPHGETPHGETPHGETPHGEAPRGETPRGETPRGETPRGEIPREEAPRGENGYLLVAAPGRIEAIGGRHLIVASGLRPATAADLNLTGDRPAGVVAGPLAGHLLRAGVRVWQTVVILGDGPWARPVAERARALGTRVVAVTDSGDWGDERFSWPARFSVAGRDRVTHLRLHTSRAPVDVRCDAVVLAADPRPNRDIDGALAEGAPAVIFHQPLRPYGARQRYELAVRSAREWLGRQQTGG